jgi:MoaA/NifB/PqqE/SkfB family radical SAM enzyme
MSFISDGINRAGMLAGKTPNLLNVYINTSGVCTNRCYMCPGRAAKTRNKPMSDTVFSTVMQRLSEYDFDGNLHFYGQNEPLTDPCIFDRIQEARKLLPRASLHMISNFTILSDSMLEKLLHMPLDRLVNSIYALDAESYEKICGRPNYNKAITNQVKFIKRWSRIKKYPFLVFLIDSEHNRSDQKFMEWFLRQLPVSKTERSPMFHTRNVLPRERNHQNFGICLFQNLLINGEGNTSICPFDHDCEMICGNIRQMGIHEIINSCDAKRIRCNIMHKKGSQYPDFCSVCDYANENKMLYFFLPQDQTRRKVQAAAGFDNGFSQKQFRTVSVNSDSEIMKKQVWFDRMFADEAHIPETIALCREKFIKNG